LRDGARKVFQCNACRHQASLIAATEFQGTKLPLTTWFSTGQSLNQASCALQPGTRTTEIPHNANQLNLFTF
jgi:hypothetical protein